MRYCLMLLGFAVVFFSCTDKNKLPSDVLRVNQLKAVIWDLEMAGQVAFDSFALRSDSLRMQSTALFQKVFDKHKMDKKTFYHSFAYYESRPDLMKTLLDSVSSYGNRRKQNLYNKAYK